MRFDCPYCEEPLMLDLDTPSDAPLYVRCDECDEVAIVRTSACLNEAARARRAEEDARREASARIEDLSRRIEILSAPPAPAAVPPTAPIAKTSARTIATPMPAPIPPAPIAAEDAERTAESLLLALPTTTEPVLLEMGAVVSPPALPPAPPRTPPAFLLRETAPRFAKFAEGDDEAADGMPASRRASQVALIVAGAIAASSGAYLFLEGRKEMLASRDPAKRPAILSLFKR